MLPVSLKKLDPEVVVPEYARANDAGLDLQSNEEVTIAPGERALVRTGLAIALPPGYAAFVQPRSGLAVKRGITVLNTPGLIDAGYRGEVMVVLLNTDNAEPFEIRKGDRIAQLVVQKVEHVVFDLVDELPTESEAEGLAIRGAGGFGHSGV